MPDTGLHGSGHCSGSRRSGRDDPSSAPVWRRPRPKSVYHVRVTGHGILSPLLVKIQGWKLYDSQPRHGLLSARGKRPITWDEAAAALLGFYRAFGTRNPVEAEKTLRALTQYFHGWQLADITTAAIQRYAVHERGRNLAAATVNLRLATLRRALRLAHERGELDKAYRDSACSGQRRHGAASSDGEFEAVAEHLPPDLELVEDSRGHTAGASTPSCYR